MKKLIFLSIGIFLFTGAGAFSNSAHTLLTHVTSPTANDSQNLLPNEWWTENSTHECEYTGDKLKITALEDLNWACVTQVFYVPGDFVPPEGLVFTVLVEGLGSTWDLNPGIYPQMTINDYSSPHPIASLSFDNGDGKYSVTLTSNETSNKDLIIHPFYSVNSPQTAGNYVYITPTLTFGTKFKSLKNVYGFRFDPLSRLTNAIYYENGQPSDSYSEKGIAYDRNGNIQTLHRAGQDGEIIYDLSYEYEGNQLKTLHNTAPTATETYIYTYDENGNMTFDGRQGMELDYNYLNLVNSVTNGSTGEVKAQYKWHADGSKLSVRTGDGNDGYEYLGSLVYKRVNGVLELESAAFGEGRIYATSGTSPAGGTSGNVVRPTTSIGTGPDMSAPPPEDHVVPGPERAIIPGIDPVEPEPVDPPIDPIDPVDPVPVEPGEPGDGGNTGGDVGTAHNHQTAYFIMDHLGSVRVVVDNNGNVLSRHDYYPFGLTMQNRDLQTGDNRYLYNGKELQQMASLDFLDYGARMHDAVRGQWPNPDALSEKYSSMSPYSFTGNNPIRYVDFNGMDWFVDSYTGNLFYIKGVSYLDQEIADSYNLGDFTNYERLGADNMFGDQLSWGFIEDVLGIDFLQFADDSQKFMNEQGYSKAEKVRVEEMEINVFMSAGFPRHGKDKDVTRLYTQKGEFGITYVRPEELNSKRIISRQTDKSVGVIINSVEYEFIKPYGGKGIKDPIFASPTTRLYYQMKKKREAK